MSISCPDPGCGYASNMRQHDAEVCRPLNLETTRSHASEDAHRDMDGFDADEELARLRRAVVEARSLSPEENPALYRFIAESFANLDEHLLREGALPRTWWSAAGETAVVR